MVSHYNALKGDYTKTQGKILEKKLGTPCFNFLEENQVLLFVLTQLLLIVEGRRIPRIHIFKNHCIDYAFILAPAIKSFEGYLKKLVKEKGLWDKEGGDVGVVFGGKRSDKIYTELRNDDYDSTPKVIFAEWNRCRNRILHYNKTFFIKTIDEAIKIYDKMLEIIKESYEAYIEDSPYLPARPIFIKAPPNIRQKSDEEIISRALDEIDEMRKRIQH